MFANDDNGFGPNGHGSGQGRHPHGQAALLLTESLMHILVENGTISREQFIEVVEGAAEVERELSQAGAAHPEDGSGSLLYPMADAFRQELGK